MKTVSVIIVTAGTASRMNGIDKQLFTLDHIPVFLHSVLTFSQIEEVCEIVIVAKKHQLSVMKQYCDEYNINKPILIVSGGETRQQSCFCGVSACQADSNYIAFHDGARPLVTVEEIRQVIRDAQHYGAASLGVPSKDTVKIVGKDGLVKTTPDREQVYSVQTPQVFEKAQYLLCMEQAQQKGIHYTDDCQLFELVQKPVFITKGSYQNIKITTPEDLSLAQQLLKQR